MSNPFDPIRPPSSFDPDIEHGPIGRDLGPPTMRVLLYYIATALPSGSPERESLLQAFSAVERVMYMSIDAVIRSECRIACQRKNLLELLSHRGLALDEPLRARVLDCMSEDHLERWFDRALAATTLADVFSAPVAFDPTNMRSPSPDDPALQARISALGPLVQLMTPTAVHALIRYVTTVLPSGTLMRARILGLISEEQRAMYLSVYEEMRAEGRAEGTIERQLEDLLKVLAHRGLVLDEPLRARVLACADEAQLERWFDRALAATTLADVFDEP